MPARRVRRQGGARRRRVVGKGFLDFAKKAFNNVVKPLISTLKPTGLISKGASFIPGIGAPLSGYLKTQGYGRRRRRVGRPRGGALMRALKI
jgi:hypothetical protein